MSVAGLKYFLTKPGGWFFFLSSRGLFNWMDDEAYIRRVFKYSLGYEPDLEHPKTFNEKLQWLKLHDHDPLYTRIVDKYEAKQYVAEKIGNQYIIPTYGVWDSFDEIDFSSLPGQFVLKCTHDSGGVVICRDKNSLDLADARKRIAASLKRNYYYTGREWPYKNVKPRILAEKLMLPGSAGEPSLTDYKLLCFDGKFDNIMVCEGRYSQRGVRFYFFDRGWNYLPYCPYDDLDTGIFPALKPSRFEEMIRIAETLSAGFPVLRVDLYETGGQVYFGELTFFPDSGFDAEITRETDLLLGNRLNIVNAGPQSAGA